MKRVLKVLATACLCMLASFSYGATAAEAVRIGVSLGLSGKYRAPAAMQKRGYELWRDEVNARSRGRREVWA